MRISCLFVRSQPARPNTRADFLVPPARVHVRRTRDQKIGKDLSIDQLIEGLIDGLQGSCVTHFAWTAHYDAAVFCCVNETMHFNWQAIDQTAYADFKMHKLCDGKS